MTVALRSFTEVLKAWGKLADRDLARACAMAEAAGEPLHLVLSRLGLLGEDLIADAVAESIGVARVADKDYPVKPILTDRLNATFLQTCRVLPIAEDRTSVTVAMADPFDDETVRALELKLGKTVNRRVATPFQLDRQIARLFNSTAAPRPTGDPRVVPDAIDIERLRDMASEVPVVRMVNDMMSDAIAENASDIHIEPTEDGLRVRHRIDGLLRPVAAPTAVPAAIVSRIKIMAGLDIVERRRPQDGRCRVNVQGRTIDVRVSCVPTLHGESVDLRILDRASAPLELSRLGLDAAVLAGIQRIIGSANGIFLVTGPTGSGKTTTLYAALQKLNRAETKLITVEDPIEYQLAGVSQIQVNPRIGLGFANILRSVLRHDPDVIMVGEIRDIDTARIAVQSALTGHVVLSTLHTNNAAGAITRLADMGVEPYLIASALNGAMAQRLVRTLCGKCKKPATPSTEAKHVIAAVGLDADAATTLHQAVGCAACADTGYSGRTAISELLEIDDAVRAEILEQADTSGIQVVAEKGGMTSLRRNGIEKVLAGMTTIEEILRVTQEH
jgi:general secretion pathway protein E